MVLFSPHRESVHLSQMAVRTTRGKQGRGKRKVLSVQLQENVKGREQGSDGVKGPNTSAGNILLCPLGLEREETPSHLTYKMQYSAGPRLRG